MPKNHYEKSWRLRKADAVVDGKIRGAKLIVLSKSTTRSTCYRPAQKLIQLEVDEKLKETDDYVDKERDEVNNDEVLADKGFPFDIVYLKFQYYDALTSSSII